MIQPPQRKETLVKFPVAPATIGLILQLPALAVIGGLLLAFLTLWDVETLAADFHHPLAGVSLLLGYMPGIFIHELLHGIGFILFCRAPLRAIRFGVSGFTAYANCRVPAGATGFRAAIALPGIALGAIPVLAGLALGSGWLTLFGALMSAAALGDVLILWTLRAIPGRVRVLYRHDRAGYHVLYDDSPHARQQPPAHSLRVSAVTREMFDEEPLFVE